MPFVSTTRIPASAGHPSAMHRVEPLWFRKQPAWFAALSFALGIACDTLLLSHWQTPALRVAATVLLILVGWMSTQAAPRCQLLCIVTAWWCLGWCCASLQTFPQSHLAIDTYADNLVREVQGTVLNIRPVPSAANDMSQDDTPSEYLEHAILQPLWSIDLQAEQIEEVTPDTSTMQPVPGGIRFVFASTQEPTVQCGDVIKLPLRMTRAQRYRDAGVWQYADYLTQQGIRVRATTRAIQIQILHHGAPSLMCRVHMLQYWASTHVAHYIGSYYQQHLPRWMQLNLVDASLLDAMLFGDRTQLQHTARLRFEETGSFHLLVVAGMHVGLLATMLLWLADRLHLPRITATCLTIAGSGMYSLLTGAAVPVQRAFWMMVVFLLVRMFSRRSSSLNALGITAILFLMLQPSMLFDSSFQMTALAVIAISGLAIPIAERTIRPYARAMKQILNIGLDAHMAPRLAHMRISLRLFAELLHPSQARRITQSLAACIHFLCFACEFVLISCMSEVVLSLPMMVYFHRLTPLALPANIVCILLISPLMLSASLFFLTLCLHPMLATLFAIPTAGLLHAIQGSIFYLTQQPLSEVRTAQPALWRVLFLLLLWSIALWMLRSSTYRYRAGLAAVVFSCAILVLPSSLHLQPNRLEVTAIDVGQGDSILVASPNGKTMLIDAGGPVGEAEMAQHSSYDFGEEVVSPYLWGRGISHLDILVLTHAHSDHMGGMPAVLRNFHPRELWVSADPDAETYRRLLQWAVQYGVQIRHLHRGNSIEWSPIRIDILAPSNSDATGRAPSNNDSLVLRLSWQAASLLLEGDAEKQSEEEMLAQSHPMKSTLLKIGHHGSRTSTTPEFLSAVSPQIALISDGKNNHFGHPRPEVLERLQEHHTQTYRTDLHGAVSVFLAPDGTFQTSTFLCP